jgi:hypothetical protein
MHRRDPINPPRRTPAPAQLSREGGRDPECGGRDPQEHRPYRRHRHPTGANPHPRTSDHPPTHPTHAANHHPGSPNHRPRRSHRPRRPGRTRRTTSTLPVNREREGGEPSARCARDGAGRDRIIRARRRLGAASPQAGDRWLHRLVGREENRDLVAGQLRSEFSARLTEEFAVNHGDRRKDCIC